jgi:DNA-binding MarR family transcriptional regulator
MIGESADRSGDDARRRAVRDVEEAFAHLLGEFRQVYAQMAAIASPGMLPGTFKTLSWVARVGPTTQSCLADRLSADKGMLSRQISELESLGMVARTADPNDGRARVIEVTPFGRERLAAAQDPFKDDLATAMDDWPLSSIDRLTTLVRALTGRTVPYPEAGDAAGPGARDRGSRDSTGAAPTDPTA